MNAETQNGLIDRIQNAVERGASNVEEIHKTIADLPLEVLERNGIFEDTAARARKFQDRSIGAVYDAVRQVNVRLTGMSPMLRPATPQFRKSVGGKNAATACTRLDRRSTGSRDSARPFVPAVPIMSDRWPPADAPMMPMRRGSTL